MIEDMTHVAVVGKAADKNAILSWLYNERAFHPMAIGDQGDADWDATFAGLPDESQNVDAELGRISAVVSFCQEHCTEKPGFLDAMLPLKVVGTRDELDMALADVSIDALSEQTTSMRTAMEQSAESIARLKNQKNAIEQFAVLGDDLPALSKLRNVALEVVAVSGQGGKAFLLDDRIVSGVILAEELFSDQTHSYYALAAPAFDADELKALIDDHGLHVHPIPVVERGAREEIETLNREIRQAEFVLDSQKTEASRFADTWVKKASLVAGYYESEKNLALARTGMAESSHLFAARGYVKSDQLELFHLRLESKIPTASVIPCPSPEGEEPPVSLKWNKWISPASLLVKMYGLPSYSSIDPTPYVFTIFFIFVGICLGDAVYGLGLIGIMLWLKNKYREQEHLQDFFQCFVYCGISSIVFGALTGSWMGDITSMIPGMGRFYNLTEKFKVIDPIQDSQLALYIAIGIGIFTQLYGMALRAYRDYRRGDTMGAFSDGLLWMAFLIFALLGGLTPSPVSTVFWFLFIVTCLLLVLTQGRDQKGWVSKILVGCIALYGIVGAYGASAILGDLISYARLMALGLTGAALGSTFNMLAKLSTDIPKVGLFVGILVVLGGHLMNFFLALLGGFVHSARLIMLEFFGRFYEAGGAAYKPYGFDSASVDMKKK